MLDLFSGSGAIGFELLSNGASSAVLVELDSAAAELIRQNARDLNILADVEAFQGDGIEAHRAPIPACTRRRNRRRAAMKEERKPPACFPHARATITVYVFLRGCQASERIDL